MSNEYVLSIWGGAFKLSLAAVVYYLMRMDESRLRKSENSGTVGDQRYPWMYLIPICICLNGLHDLCSKY